MLQSGGVSYEVFPPTAAETPLVVEVPHAGLFLDAQSLATCTAPARSIAEDADLYVDELYADAPEEGATLLVARSSRYVCDLNRSEKDLDAHTTPGGEASAAPHGVIWRRTTLGAPAIAAPLPAPEVERRLELVYRPYHAELERLLLAKEARFGYSILLCAHSMPSSGRLGERRADVVPGSRGHSTAALAVIQTVESVSRDFGFDLIHDDPYRGGFTTQHHGRPERARHAIQIELARRRYMDEKTLAKNSTFDEARRFSRGLTRALSLLGHAALRHSALEGSALADSALETGSPAAHSSVVRAAAGAAAGPAGAPLERPRSRAGRAEKR